MFLRPLFLLMCVLLCVCCLFGLYRLQAETPRAARPQPQEVAEPHSDVTFPSRFAESDISSDFYQTIIKNNLFAPLGTVLNAEPEPGTHLSLLGTFVSEDPSDSSVLVKNATTGRHHLLSVGEGVGDFHVLAVEAKQVRFYHHGTEVKVHLSESENLFLNTNRR